MAADLLMLEAFPDPDAVRYRHYGWIGPSWTFGYSQKYDWVRAQVTDPACELVRRPTGGGMVDHRHDWTFALVIPPGHALYRSQAVNTYRLIHEVLALSLAKHDCPARVHDPAATVTTPAPAPKAAATEGGPKLRARRTKRTRLDTAPGTAMPAATALATPPSLTLGPGACFHAPEIYDVVNPSGRKLAGAAQKRNRNGLLLQGSIDRSATGHVAWHSFHKTFLNGLMDLFALDPEAMPWPEWPSDSFRATVDRFGSDAWNKRR